MTEFQPFRLDSENQCVWRGPERLVLTPKAFFLLKYLVDRAGRLVTHQELLESLWPDVFVQRDVLKTHILDIRQALGDDAKAPKYIETQPRQGYRFIANVQNGEVAKPMMSPAPSIAVLPFANLGNDKEHDYFGDGLAEDIINELTKAPCLKVIARTSAFAFKGRSQDTRRIAAVLGVSNVLEGSFRNAGNRVRVTAHLIAASDGSHLWSGRYDKDRSDILTIQDEIATAIANALETQLRGPGERRPTNPEAYQAYLEGRYYVQQVTAQSISRALECYERAISLDPGYALPHSGLALRAYYQVLYLAQRPRELVPAALTSLGRALQLDPGSAQSHVVRGVFSAFYEYTWDVAEEHFIKAVEMDPASPMAHLGRALWFLLPTQRLAEALDEIQRSVALDPFSPAIRAAELWILYTMRRQEATDRARTLTQLFPALPICRYASSVALLSCGLIEEAVTTLEEGLRIVPGDVFLLGVLALARAGRRRAAEAAAIRKDLEKRAEAGYVPFLPRAYAAEACGDAESAYFLMERAIGEREPLAVITLAARRLDLPTGYQSLLPKMGLA